MGWLSNIIDWFSGNGRYHDLIHCMGHDWPWITVTIALDLTVATGYGLIAVHWWTNARHLQPSPAKHALNNLRNIFLFCGICGYIFIPVKMFWPAWRLYDVFMLALAYFTWRYAWGAKDLKVVYSELNRSQKLAADLEQSREESSRKSFFLNALSHDLRTPLNGLMLQANFADLSLRNGDASAARGALHEIQSCTRATASLLESLLEYAKVDWSDEANAAQQVDVDELARAVVERHAREATDKGLRLHVGSSLSGLRCRTDRVKLDRILTNLVSNAVKFTSTGEVRLEAERQGQGVEIHVIDTGIGIDPSSRGRLFEEFYQAHNHERDPRKGVGLGLAIARRIARQLGGDIDVHSSPGGGSRFSVRLPDDGRADELASTGRADASATRPAPLATTGAGAGG
jgi:signal transduction histidine kinase